MTAKRRRWLVAGSLVFSAIVWLVVEVMRAINSRDVSKENPQDIFRSFVCDPIPSSVSNVEASGILAFAGGHVVVDFSIEDRDRETLLLQGRFLKPGEKDTGWINQGDPFGDVGGSVSFFRPNDGMNQTALYLAKRSTRARFHLTCY